MFAASFPPLLLADRATGVVDNDFRGVVLARAEERLAGDACAALVGVTTGLVPLPVGVRLLS